MEEEIKKEPESLEDPKVPLLEERVEQKEDFQTLIRGRYREEFEQALTQALSAQARETQRYLAYRELRQQGEAVKSKYPDFDLMRELENPAFARLVNNAVDPQTAYEVVHHGDLAQAETIRAQNAARPLENGLGSAAVTVFHRDPKALTRQERRQLRRRAARGEEIVW